MCKLHGTNIACLVSHWRKTLGSHDGSDGLWLILHNHACGFCCSTGLTLSFLQHSYGIVAAALGLSAAQGTGQCSRLPRIWDSETRLLWIAQLLVQRESVRHFGSLSQQQTADTKTKSSSTQKPGNVCFNGMAHDAHWSADEGWNVITICFCLFLICVCYMYVVDFTSCNKQVTLFIYNYNLIM